MNFGHILYLYCAFLSLLIVVHFLRLKNGAIRRGVILLGASLAWGLLVRVICWYFDVSELWTSICAIVPITVALTISTTLIVVLDYLMPHYKKLKGLK